MSTEKGKETKVYSHTAPWDVYALAFSSKPSYKYRLACGSFIEDATNKVSVIQLNENREQFQELFTFDHKFPCSKIMWIPDLDDAHPDQIVTAGEFLKIWTIHNNSQEELISSLENTQQKETCGPLTSFDWNTQYLNIICTSSLDTTCSIWDISTGSTIKQLIAHDKEVFDISFSPDANVFATVGADGSARKFDSRDQSKSDIIYETNDPQLRVSWNKNNENYIAVIGADQNFATLVDIRKPFQPACKLYYHTESVNHLSWAPHSSQHLCTVSDDQSALIWDLTDMGNEVTTPLLEYSAGGEVNNLTWSLHQSDWVGLSFGKNVQILRVY